MDGRSRTPDLFGRADRLPLLGVLADQDGVSCAMLAWLLRQRDTRRARALADQAEPLLTGDATLSADDRERLLARLDLVRAEADALFADMPAATAQLDRARRRHLALGDGTGLGDGWLIQGDIALMQGDHEQALACHDQAARLLADDPDPVRRLAAHAKRLSAALSLTPQDGAAAAAALPDVHTLDDPGLSSLVHGIWGTVHFDRGDYARAGQRLQAAFDDALAAGQIQPAIQLAGRIGHALRNLNDYSGALIWREKAYELARPTGWPASIGQALRNLGDTLRLLKQPDRAKTMLLEAMDWIAPFRGTRLHAGNYLYLGELYLDLGDSIAALTSFEELELLSAPLCDGKAVVDGRRGQALALSTLGKGPDALSMAHAALALARDLDDRWRQIACLRALASVHRRHPLPPPAEMRHASPAIHYLHQALAITDTIEGYTLSLDLLGELARDHEAAGDLAGALRFERQAVAVRERLHTREATDRMLAVQVRYDMERTQAEAEHHRALAAAETKRAEALELANQRLDRALADLRATQDKLVQQEKLASLGRLVAGVAHEINTPLGIAITTASHLEREVALLAEALEGRRLRQSDLTGFIAGGREALGILSANLNRAGQLVQDFKLLAADRGLGGPQTLDLGEFLADQLDSLRPLLAGAGVRASLDLPPEPLRITTYPAPLGQVVANLVRNAAAHAFAGIQHPTLCLLVSTAGPGKVGLTVADNGVGMDEAVLRRAFDPFFTTRRDAGGSGLGLHIVHTLVTGPLEGQIDLISAPGAGTCAMLRLPLRVGAVPEPARVESPA